MFRNSKQRTYIATISQLKNTNLEIYSEQEKTSQSYENGGVVRGSVGILVKAQRKS